MRLSENVLLESAYFDDENDLFIHLSVNGRFQVFYFDQDLTGKLFTEFCQLYNLDETETRENIFYYMDEIENFFDRYQLTYIRKLI
jgi:hypothetical protein